VAAEGGGINDLKQGEKTSNYRLNNIYSTHFGSIPVARLPRLLVVMGIAYDPRQIHHGLAIK
jgi:hypothetical protein